MECAGRNTLRSLLPEESMAEEKQDVFQQFGKGTLSFLGNAEIGGMYTNEGVTPYVGRGHQGL